MHIWSLVGLWYARPLHTNVRPQSQLHLCLCVDKCATLVAAAAHTWDSNELTAVSATAGLYD